MTSPAATLKASSSRQPTAVRTALDECSSFHTVSLSTCGDTGGQRGTATPGTPPRAPRLTPMPPHGSTVYVFGVMGPAGSRGDGDKETQGSRGIRGPLGTPKDWEPQRTEGSHGTPGHPKDWDPLGTRTLLDTQGGVDLQETEGSQGTRQQDDPSSKGGVPGIGGPPAPTQQLLAVQLLAVQGAGAVEQRVVLRVHRLDLLQRRLPAPDPLGTGTG